MGAIEKLITENLPIWSSSVQSKSTQGRGSSSKRHLYGVKKLRELILDLAVRGLLVPQDPNDEPASVLLEKIAAEKEQLYKQKKIKKPKIFPPVEIDESPYLLTVSWSWQRLGTLCRKVTDGSHNPPKNAGKGLPMLSSQNINYGRIDFSNPSRYVTQKDFDKEDLRTSIQGGDVLLNIVASIGRSAVVPHDAPKFVLQRSVAVLSSLMISDYLAKTLVALTCLNYYELHAKGTAQKGIYLGKLSLMPIAVPPLAEQHRIVAKVDELMALCDTLEQQQEDSIQAHETLVETLLSALTNASDAESFQSAWQRVSAHFDTLLTTEHSIDKLKETILQLAVMGKLVPQDPSDEPASVLLEKIAVEKEQLISDGIIKKPKTLPKITEDESTLTIPSGWEWCKFGLISIFLNGDRGKNYPNKNEYVDSGIPWINTGHIKKDGLLSTLNMNYITNEKFKSLKAGKIKYGDLVYCLRGATFGKTAFVEPYTEGAIASSLMIIRPFIGETRQYIFNYLISPFGRSQIFRFDNGSAQPNLSANSVCHYALPLPPLAEQHRIVAKVDELMALCDDLKRQLNEAQITQMQLTDAVTEQAVN